MAFERVLPFLKGTKTINDCRLRALASSSKSNSDIAEAPENQKNQKNQKNQRQITSLSRNQISSSY